MGLPECLGRSEISKIYPQIAPILDVWLEPTNCVDGPTFEIGHMILYYLESLKKDGKYKINLKALKPRIIIESCREIFEDVCFSAISKKGDAVLGDPGFSETLSVKGQRYPQEKPGVRAVGGLVFVLNNWGVSWAKDEEPFGLVQNKKEEYVKIIFGQAMLDFAQEILDRKSSQKRSLE